MTFENVIEKLGRILTSQYNIDVMFEGNTAHSDGKKIVLPYMEKLTPELKQDLSGLLDHEAARCKFTDFKEPSQIKTKFHRALFNLVEDSRIQQEMIREYPGCVFSLTPLNEKNRAKHEEDWDKKPWPVRTILAVKDIMEGRAPRIDKDIEDYVDVVRDAANVLGKCKDSKDVREKTETIVRMIVEENERKKKKKKEKKKDDKMPSPPGGGKPDDKDKDEPKTPDEKPTPEEKMLSDKVSEKSELDDHALTVQEMVNSELKSEMKEDIKNPGSPYHRGFEKKMSIPTTTRFDKVTDHSGKGNQVGYAKLKREVVPLVAPIKAALERILKVKEDARWRSEKEQGKIDARALSKLASNQNYRTIFKEFTKVDTNNVAVEILVDESGSMSGSKIHTAKMAAIAMAEALRDIAIPFEVTGFTSIGDHAFASFSEDLFRKDPSLRGRFNRHSERLDLHIYKGFDSHSLIGLEQMKAMVQNPDGECVVWAAKRLSARKEKRKILMVMSDGMPCADGNSSVLNYDLKKRVEQIKKSGIEVVGIGICTNVVKDFYPEYIVIDNLKDLPKIVMSKLAKLIGG